MTTFYEQFSQLMEGDKLPALNENTLSKKEQKVIHDLTSFSFSKSTSATTRPKNIILQQKSTRNDYSPYLEKIGKKHSLKVQSVAERSESQLSYGSKMVKTNEQLR